MQLFRAKTTVNAISEARTGLPGGRCDDPGKMHRSFASLRMTKAQVDKTFDFQSATSILQRLLSASRGFRRRSRRRGHRGPVGIAELPAAVHELGDCGEETAFSGLMSLGIG